MKNLWTKRNILDYLRYPEEILDKNYSPVRRDYRKKLRRLDEETKKDGGVVNWSIAEEMGRNNSK